MACRTSPGAPGRPAREPSGAENVAPANAATFVALQGALEDGDDELAARIVALLRQRGLTRREGELTRSAERVLAGRSLVRALELRLESEPLGDEPSGSNRYRLLLRARSSAAASLVLNLPPADLKRLRAAVDARGFEGLEYESRATSALSSLELEPLEERSIELLTYELPLGMALGVRERWRCETRSGEIRSGREVFPAARVAVAGCERERLSPLVAGGAAEPGELVAMLDVTGPLETRALLETALRIERSRRAEALTALAPLVERLSSADPARVDAAEPALRWLSGNRELGRDARAWAAYLRFRAGEPQEAGERGNLDLP